MLNGTRNAAGNIKIRRDDFAGLPYLPIVRCVSGIDSRARCADRRAKLVCDRQDDFLELSRLGAECTTAGNDERERT